MRWLLRTTRPGRGLTDGSERQTLGSIRGLFLLNSSIWIPWGKETFVSQVLTVDILFMGRIRQALLSTPPGSLSVCGCVGGSWRATLIHQPPSLAGCAVCIDRSAKLPARAQKCAGGTGRGPPARARGRGPACLLITLPSLYFLLQRMLHLMYFLRLPELASQSFSAAVAKCPSLVAYTRQKGI